MSVEELVGRLKPAEERHDPSGAGNNSIARLNLTQEELVSKQLQLAWQWHAGMAILASRV